MIRIVALALFATIGFCESVEAQNRPGTFSTLRLTDTSATAALIGCALGVSTGCTGTIVAGSAKFTTGIAIDGATVPTHGIAIAAGVPSSTAFTLYSSAGTLMWNGIALAAGSSLSGTLNQIPRYTAANAVGDSIMAQDAGATKITVTGTFNATTAIQLNGTSINTGATLSNVAYLDQANYFTSTSGQRFKAGIAIDDGVVSTHGIQMPSAVPGVTSNNLYNNAGALTWSGSLTLGTQLSVANGGTGLTTLAANRIPYGNGTSAFQSASAFTFDGRTQTLNNGSTSSDARTMYGTRTYAMSIVGAQSLFGNNADYTGSAWTRLVAGLASAMRFGAITEGGITWHISSSSTAGSALSNWDSTDIKMALFPSGGLSVGGTTDPGTNALSVYGNLNLFSTIVNQLGGAGSPSYSFTGDSNTGLYSEGADEVDLAAGGVKVAGFTGTLNQIKGVTYATGVGSGFAMLAWPTTASAANAFLADGSQIARSTSSLAYKNVTARLSLDEAKRMVAEMPAPIWYRSKVDTDQRLWLGWGAEEVAPSVPVFATFDASGHPNYVTYDRVSTVLVPLAADHEQRIAALEAEIATLKAQVH